MEQQVCILFGNFFFTHSSGNGNKLTFCVHGEGEKIERYAQAIRDRLGWNVIVPHYLESVELFSGI